MAVRTQAGEILSYTVQRANFARDGYLVLDDPCPPDLLEAVLAEAESLYEDDFIPGPRSTRTESYSHATQVVSRSTTGIAS